MSVELTAQEVWSLILKESTTVINDHAFKRWLEPTTATTLANDRVVVEVPNQFSADYVDRHFKQILSNIGTSLFNRNFGVLFEPALDSDERVEKEAAAPQPTFMVENEVTSRPVLHSRFRFENFVVGQSNKFAHAASRAVTESPATTYNPLFIYGGVGLGKTHLLEAIANKIIEERTLNRIHYSSTETFMNEMIQSIKQGKMADFRNRYRKMDLLLIDDVQFLANKESTQEEFFHTFNALYDSQKQIVLTSDRPPKDIPTLEERLVSRFGWGLVADILPPDLETRIAILRHKADTENLCIPDEVLLFIANNVTSNVRQLESSLVRLSAHTSLVHENITLDLAKEVLKDIILGEIKKIPIKKILSTVAQKYDTPVENLKSKGRTRPLSNSRQIAMYLCRLLTDYSLVEIGSAFGGRDHTTVIHACEKITRKMRTDGHFKAEVSSLVDCINQN